LHFQRSIPTVNSPEKSIFGCGLPGVSVAKNIVFGKEYRVEQSAMMFVCALVPLNAGTLLTSRTELCVGLIVRSAAQLFNCTLLMMGG